MQVLIKESTIDKTNTFEYLPNTNKKALILSDYKFILKKNIKINVCLHSSGFLNHIRIQARQGS